MEHHNFNFEYGDILSHIGAAWYASYAYHRHCDPVHNNYTIVSTWKTRASTYKRHLELEKYFIERISEMSSKKLDTNNIGLSGEEVLRMATKVLKQL
jgi:hypothetical protein